MSETIEISVVDTPSSTQAASKSAHIMASPDGTTLTISMAEFVANPETFATALASITRRPIQLQFV
jgi:hypothetical protein